MAGKQAWQLCSQLLRVQPYSSSYKGEKPEVTVPRYVRAQYEGGANILSYCARTMTKKQFYSTLAKGPYAATSAMPSLMWKLAHKALRHPRQPIQKYLEEIDSRKDISSSTKERYKRFIYEGLENLATSLTTRQFNEAIKQGPYASHGSVSHAMKTLRTLVR